MELSTLKRHMKDTPIDRVNIALLPDNEALLVVHYTRDRKADVIRFNNHRILRATLAHWFVIYGVRLTIDNEDAGKIHRYNEELVKGYFPACNCHKRFRANEKFGNQQSSLL